MLINLDFFVEDENGDDFQVVCVAECDGQEPDHRYTDSQEDYEGFFDVVEITFKSITGVNEYGNEYEIAFEDCSAELQESINEQVEILAARYKE